MSVLILGDVHLGKGVSIGKNNSNGALNSRIIDQNNLLEWVLQYSYDNVINNIIITGDVFEEVKPHHSLISLFISWLKKCDLYNINVHIIIGNHDIVRSGSNVYSPLDIVSNSEFSNISIYKQIDTIYIDNIAYTLIPFMDRKNFSTSSNEEAILELKNLVSYELCSIPEFYKKVVVGHLAIEKSIPVGDEIDDLTNELFCPIDMFVGYDYVWMGHVHTPQVMNKSNPYVAHIGSMDVSNFGETNQKKHIVVIDKNLPGFFKKENLPIRKLKKISISVPEKTADSTNYVVEQIAEMDDDFKGSIVKLEIFLETSEIDSVNKQFITQSLLDKGVFNVAKISESKKISLIKKLDDDEDNIDTGMSVNSAIETFVKKYVDEDLQNDVIELANDVVLRFKNGSK